MLIVSPTVGVTAISMVKLNHNCERNFVLDLHACILVFFLEHVGELRVIVLIERNGPMTHRIHCSG
jgi:hypothetical protein